MNVCLYDTYMGIIVYAYRVEKHAPFLSVNGLYTEKYVLLLLLIIIIKNI